MTTVQTAQDVPDPQDLLSDWRAWLLGERCLSPLTAERYGWRMGYFLPLCDKHPLDVSTSDLRQHLLAVCPKPNTKHAALRAFRSFFGFLAAEGYRDDPSRAIRAPRVPDSMPKYLTLEEARKLDEAAYWEGLTMHALCRVYLFQGLRCAEGCNLAWREPRPTDLKAGLCTGVVDLEEGWMLVRGKGAKDRELPIHPKTREALKKLHKYRKSDLWLFPRRRSGQERLPITTATAAHAVYRWAHTAGIEKGRVSVHKLRHTFATSYLASGADITYVQAALGHSDIHMTMRYARVRKEDLRRTIGRVKYD